MKRHLVVCLAVTILILAGYAPAYGDSWSLSLGGYSTDFAYDIKQTADGGYIVAGVTASFTNANDAWVLKLSPSGAVEWQKTYGRAGYNSANSIQQTADGGYIVAGMNHGDAWVLKLSANGNIDWQKTYGGSGFDYANAIQQTTDGGYIVAGTTRGSGAGEADALILKLSGGGSIEWQKTYGGAGLESASAIQQTADQGYIVTGYTNSFGAGGADVWLLKLEKNGSEDWQKTWGGHRKILPPQSGRRPTVAISLPARQLLPAPAMGMPGC